MNACSGSLMMVSLLLLLQMLQLFLAVLGRRRGLEMMHFETNHFGTHALQRCETKTIVELAVPSIGNQGVRYALATTARVRRSVLFAIFLYSFQDVRTRCCAS